VISRVGKSFPRVLIVNGEPFNTRSATGLTLHSLFKDWPRERLACLHIADVVPTAGACSIQWRLTPADMAFVPAVYRVLGGAHHVARPKGGARAGAVVSEPNRSPVEHHRKFREKALALLRQQSFGQLAWYQPPPRFWEEVKAFRPELIYTMLGSNAMLRLVLDVRARCKVPIVPHMMDDWPAILYRDSVLRPVLRSQIRRRLARVFAYSPVRFTIGTAMAEAYEGRYGGQFTPFLNAVEPEWLSRSCAQPTRGRRLLVTYVGGLHLGRWRALLELGEQVGWLRGEGLDAEVLVHTQSRFAAEARRLDLPGIIRLGGPLEPREVPPVLRAADVLVHVESFDPQFRSYTRYSVSTKIPECMGAGRPILAYGPGELASVSYVEKAGAGIGVGCQDASQLRAALRRLLGSEELREQLGSRGFEVASQHHDAAKQRERFRALLVAAAAAAPS
jgi:glycosyltransferase involved in cell wall biosynthesis